MNAAHRLGRGPSATARALRTAPQSDLGAGKGTAD